MDFGFSEKEQALKRELDSFVKTEFPPGWIGYGPWEEYATEEGWEVTRQTARKLAGRGWLTMSWPKEHGGLGASNVEQLIYRETMAYHRVPGVDMGVGGVGWVGPTLMVLGTEEQKREHLPGIAQGERFWCTGYSEPEAGSDLGGLQCRAVEDGDDFVVNGQKVWTTAAQRADWCWLAVRTDPKAPKHKGISVLLVGMRSPGVSVRPLANIGGIEENCEVFFDDVRVPKSDLVGEKNRGWQHIMMALDFERGSAMEWLGRARRMVDELVEYARDVNYKGQKLGKEPLVRHRLADLATSCEVGRTICYRLAWMLDRGIIANYEASMAKNFSAELAQLVANTATLMLGLYAQLQPGSKWTRLGGYMTREYCCSPGWTLGGGASEINRNIIATRGLGLPRE